MKKEDWRVIQQGPGREILLAAVKDGLLRVRVATYNEAREIIITPEALAALQEMLR